VPLREKKGGGPLYSGRRRPAAGSFEQATALALMGGKASPSSGARKSCLSHGDAYSAKKTFLPCVSRRRRDHIEKMMPAGLNSAPSSPSREEKRFKHILQAREKKKKRRGAFSSIPSRRKKKGKRIGHIYPMGPWTGHIEENGGKGEEFLYWKEERGHCSSISL